MNSTRTGLTVVVRRRIKEGSEADFEDSMRDFVKFALNFKGHHSINIIRPSEGSREYVVVDRFTDQKSRDEFTACSEYKRWMECLDEYTEGVPHFQQMSGLEGWFSSPGEVLRTPPKYKMAVATWIGVCIVVFLLNAVLAPFIADWGYVYEVVVFNACVVILLTWVVMPLLTKMLGGWLFGRRS